jgi:hypothetical protein
LAVIMAPIFLDEYILLDIMSPDNNMSIVPEKRHVASEKPQNMKRAKVAQATNKATTQSWVDVVKSKPRKRLKGALTPIIKQ